MRRTLVIIAALLALFGSVGNPHFLVGGAYDVYGFAPRWQEVGAPLDLIALAVGATLLWRGVARGARTVLLCEIVFFSAKCGRGGDSRVRAL